MSTNYTTKEWKDRVSQNPNQRILTDTTSGTTQTVTVMRDEGTITEPGDVFNAATMNDLEDRIDNSVGLLEKGIKAITRSGTTFTATRLDNTTFTFTQQDTTYGVATTTSNGLMSKADKTKLNGIAAGANNYTLPTASSSTLGGVKVGSNLSISNGTLSAKTASTSQAGYMTSAMVTKLNGIASGATNTHEIRTALGVQTITTSGGFVTITNGKPSGTILACLPVGIASVDLKVGGPKDSSFANLKNGQFYIVNTSSGSKTAVMHVLWIYY